ncbi:MAG: hypothetical protein KatS3mg115_0576 [Candidatus Poribacteria bacterium]|nr:MAG: hypothetical protein KatS3mg115_0576 [Candidatus Poribacteria bacterium]
MDEAAGRFRRAARPYLRRLRLRRVLEGVALGWAVGGVLLALGALGFRVLGSSGGRLLLGLPVLGAICGIGVTLFRLPGPVALLRGLDRRYGLADRLSTAWELSGVESGSPFRPLVIAEGERTLQRVPRPSPVKRTVGLLVLLGLLTSWGGWNLLPEEGTAPGAGERAPAATLDPLRELDPELAKELEMRSPVEAMERLLREEQRLREEASSATQALAEVDRALRPFRSEAVRSGAEALQEAWRSNDPRLLSALERLLARLEAVAPNEALTQALRNAVAEGDRLSPETVQRLVEALQRMEAASDRELAERFRAVQETKERLAIVAVESRRAGAFGQGEAIGEETGAPRSDRTDAPRLLPEPGEEAFVLEAPSGEGDTVRIGASSERDEAPPSPEVGAPFPLPDEAEAEVVRAVRNPRLPLRYRVQIRRYFERLGSVQEGE